MHLLIFGLGVSELLIILAVVLLLFGGSRLAGLGKSSGRALREFKEETRDLKASDEQPGVVETGAPTATDFQAPPASNTVSGPPTASDFQEPGNVAEADDREPPQRPHS